MKKYYHLLKHIPLFKGLSYDDFEFFFNSNLHRIVEYKKNSIIYFQNELCKTLDVILKGTIIVQKIDSDGNVLTISDFSVTDVLGGNLLFSANNIYPLTVISKTDTTILSIEKDLILHLCQSNTDFLKEFLQSISDKTLLLTNKIKALTMKTIRKCIIEFLLYEYYSQKSTKIKLNTSKKEFAEKLGVQRPSLSRELSKMRSDGLITFDSKYIVIKDVESLKKFSH